MDPSDGADDSDGRPGEFSMLLGLAIMTPCRGLRSVSQCSPYVSTSFREASATSSEPSGSSDASSSLVILSDDPVGLSPVVA